MEGNPHRTPRTLKAAGQGSKTPSLSVKRSLGRDFHQASQLARGAPLVLTADLKFGVYQNTTQFCDWRVMSTQPSGCILKQATSLVDGSTVCLKEYKKSEFGDTLKIGSVQWEVSVLKSIRCIARENFLCEALGAFENDMSVYLVMEKCSEDLLKYAGRFPARKIPEQFAATNIVKPVLSALNCLHLRGWMHRDVKPENVLLNLPTVEDNVLGACSRIQVKLCDFGTAIRQSLEPTSFCGTVQFMSPETLRGEVQTAKVDIWSAGVLAFEIVTGRLPFLNPSQDRSLQECLVLGTPSLPDFRMYSPHFVNFIQMTLARNSWERPSAADLLHHPWLQEKPVFPRTCGRPKTAWSLRTSPCPGAMLSSGNAASCAIKGLQKQGVISPLLKTPKGSHLEKIGEATSEQDWPSPVRRLEGCFRLNQRASGMEPPVQVSAESTSFTVESKTDKLSSRELCSTNVGGSTVLVKACGWQPFGGQPISPQPIHQEGTLRPDVQGPIKPEQSIIPLVLHVMKFVAVSAEGLLQCIASLLRHLDWIYEGAFLAVLFLCWAYPK